MDVVGVNYEEELEMKKLTEEAKKEVRQNHIINLKKNEGEKNEEMKEKQRNMKIEMQMKIMEEVEENMKKMKKDFKNEGQQRKKQNQEINIIVQKQDNTLNQRLARRKKRLRKKSADLKEKEVIEVETPPIPKAQLIEMKQIVKETY